MSYLPWKKLSQTSLAFLTGLLLSYPGGAALELPDYPLFLSTAGVKPNVLMTFDDSGSMRRGWVPESVTSSQSKIDGPQFKSPSVNGIYYNPNLIYPIPTRSDNVTYSTSFTNAYFNGFDTSKGAVNLSSNYKVVGQSQPIHNYSECPCYNTSSCSNSGDYLTTSPPSGKCRLVRHPASISSTPRTATCTVFFDRRDGDDEITASGTATECNSIFSGISKDVKVTIKNAGAYSKQYTVNSVLTNAKIRIKESFAGDSTQNNVTIEWVQIETTGGNTAGVAAYYYLYYQDKPDAARPANCKAAEDNRSNDQCYIKIVVGSSDDIASGSSSEQKQNFANWYSFYRTRAMAVMSGAMSAVTGLKADSVRLGWHTLNECKSFGTSCQGYDNKDRTNRITTLSSDHKTNYYNWLQRLNIQTGTTPLRSALGRAGNYFTKTGKDTPYAEDPYVTQGTQHACRKNFNVLFTDGLWNKETFTTPGGNADIDSSVSTTLPDGKTYSPKAPYNDVNASLSSSYTNSSSLADIAFYYWATDLTNLPNNVAQSIIDQAGSKDTQYWNAKNNPATWQHMTNYAIGLGLSASLVNDCYYNPSAAKLDEDPNNPNPGCPIWGGSTFAGDYGKILNGTKNWPKINLVTETNEEPDGHVYDLWHLAVNSRGKFYSADDPAQLIAAFEDVMDTISSIADSGGGAALSTNTSIVNSKSAVYKALFSGDGSGDLIALPTSLEGDLSDDTAAYWHAANGIPAIRNILTISDTGEGQEFDECTGSLAVELNRYTKDNKIIVDNRCEQRLNFLRSNWLPAAKTPRGEVYGTVKEIIWKDGFLTFTVPEHGFTLGDSVNVAGAKPADFNGTYTITEKTKDTFSVEKTAKPTADWESGGIAEYADFRNRSSTVLGGITHSAPAYVHNDNQGYANGSMAITGRDSYESYVATKTARPPMLYVGANDGMLHAFSAPDCTSVTDCASKGAGVERFAYVPRGVYGKLSKLTDPAYSNTFYVDGSPTVGDVYIGGWKTYLVGSLRGGGKSIFALDISNPDSFSADDVKWEFTDANLWQTYSQPQIGADTSSRWVAVFGNGYKDAKDISTTSDQAYLYVVNLSNGSQIAKLSPSSDQSNGLGTPLLHDSNQDGVIDSVYAGDLKGRLWKFFNSNGTWSVGNGGKPLFKAEDSNLLAQPITVKPAIISHPEGGYLIYFGTGKYLESKDLTDRQAQTFYAVWDHPNTPSGTTLDRNSLRKQSIIEIKTVDGENVRITSDEAPDWKDHRGWYLDLPASSASEPAERIIAPALTMKYENAPSRVLFMTNILSSDPCSLGGRSWLMEVDLYSGRRTETSVYDLNGDGLFDDKDLIGGKTVSGMELRSEYGLVGTPLLLEYSKTETIKNADGTTTEITRKYISKAVTGSKGKSGTLDAKQDAGNRVKQISAPSGGTRIYWKQIQ